MDALLIGSLGLFVLVLVLAALLAVYSDPQEVDQEELSIVERRESKRWQQSHQT